MKHITGGAKEIDRLLSGIAKRNAPPLRELGIERARIISSQTIGVLDLPPVAGVQVETHALAGAGASLRVSTPAGDMHGDTVLLWMHGGGFCVGSAQDTDGLCSFLAQGLKCTVASLDYRLTPEHKIGSALQDAIDAMHWCAERFPGAKFIVGGESAGATLALAASRAASTPATAAPEALLMIYPLVLPSEVATASRERYGSGHFLDMGDLRWMHVQSGFDEAEHLHPLSQVASSAASPATRTLIATAGRDPLCDEGQALAAQLRAMGGAVHEIHLPEMTHGCLQMTAMVPASRLLREAMVDFVVS
ncbi:MAG: alpha/beta hydrolase fold domain-containing protein [Ramlibacter sp.]|nr:alpha/beta hydrolase fold domain-containing protein [Ramlibacter sp.]